MSAVTATTRIDLKAHLLLETRKPDDIDSPAYLSLPPVSEEFPDVFVTNDDVGNKVCDHEWIIDLDCPWYFADFEDTDRFAGVLKATVLQARILNASEAFGLPVADFAGDITESFEVAGEIEIGGVVYVAYVSQAA
jgi:hypothetical protein